MVAKKALHSLSIIRPPGIGAGARIGIIAPAGPVNPSELDPAIKFLESRGYGVVLGSSVYEQKEYLAGPDISRKTDLGNMFQDHEIHAIFCARGGYGSLRLLDMIDYEIIGSNPKIFLGYSDVTALLLAFYKEKGIVTFHGPVLRDVRKVGEGNFVQLMDFFSDAAPGINLPKSCKVLVSGRAKGRLLGGNLTLLSHMVGTPYLPSFDGSILFFEDKGEPVYKLDRMLTHLKLSGVLEGIVGVLAGNFVQCGDPSLIDDLLYQTFGALKIPVISGFPIGHGRNNVVIPVGVKAELDLDHGVVRFLESYLS